MKSTLFAITFGLMASSAIAQESGIPFSDLPPTAEYGKCYAKCKIPDVYETVETQVLLTPERTKTVKVPAQYETYTEQVLVREGGKTYKTIPATYKTVTEQVMVEPERTITHTVPAKYTTESYQVVVSEARGEWVKKKKAPNCFSQNPEDCYVVCWEEVPAKYRTETRTVEVTPASTTQSSVPARYKTITRQVVDQPAQTVEINIEPKYSTVSKRRVVTPESVRQEVEPARYTTKKDRRLVKAGGYTVWTEILCESKTTSDKVLSMQQALKDAGYDPGTVDGVMGIKTQAAMKQFQTDKGLPVGNMNMETLKALNVASN